MTSYHESLLSVAYAGNAHGFPYCKPALQTLLRHWPWTATQRRQIIVRSDAGQGTDHNISYLLWLGFQVLTKGYSGRRTQAWVAQTPETAWQVDPANARRWAAPTPRAVRLGRRLPSYLVRWRNAQEQLQHATRLSTLPDPVFPLWDRYHGRGAMEGEIRADKAGLALAQRRKHALNAQEAWLILTDVAHNLLAWLHPWMLAGSPFATFGPKRLVHDLLAIPGHVTFVEGRLHEVALLDTHPYAPDMRVCLAKLLQTFDLACVRAKLRGLHSCLLKRFAQK